MRPFYITTPIYYVNDLPHIGHIYTTTVADVLARYRRMAGDDVRFLTGTDEHGQNIERAAKKEGVAPLALADRVVARYYEVRDQMALSYDDFLRTTEERHTLGVQEIIRRIDARGDLYTAKHEGWYCSPCETFYTEKELGEGKICPVHGTPVEWKSEDNVFFKLSLYQGPLLDWYARHPEAVRPASRLNEVRSFVESGLKDLSVSRASVTWGIPFPGRPGHTVYVWLDALTNYISALGFGRKGEEAVPYRHWWESAESMRLHLMGKDILRFHAVFWPAFLMSAGLPLPTTVWAHGWWMRDGRKVSKSAGNVVRPDYLITEFGADPLRYFLLREMVFGQDAMFSDEAFIDRYNSDLANDLGNTVSRLVTLSRKAFDGKTPPVPCDDNPLIEAARRVVPEYRAAMDEFAFHRALEALWRLLAEANQYIVTREPWQLVKSEPGSERLSRVLWNGLEAVRIVASGLLPFMPGAAAQVLAAIGTPEPPTSVLALEWGGTPNGAELPAPAPLFPRIDKAAYLERIQGEAGNDDGASQPAGKKSAGKKKEIAGDQLTLPAAAAGGQGAHSGPKKPGMQPAGAGKSPGEAAGGHRAAAPEAAGGSETAAPKPPAPADGPGKREEGKGVITIDKFFETQLKVATVVAAERVAKSNKLLKLTVDLGEETRTVVAGIAQQYEPEPLVGRQVVIVANLEPAKLMGVESQGMVLAASIDGKPVLLHPEVQVPNGTRVR